jgi:hypothetical protein
MKRPKNSTYKFKTRNRFTDYDKNDNKINSVSNFRTIKTKEKASYKNMEDNEISTPKKNCNDSVLKQIDLICKKIYKNPRIAIDKNIIKVNYINDSNKMNFYFGNRNENPYCFKSFTQMPLKSNSKRDRFNYKSINNLSVNKKGKNLLLNMNIKEEPNNYNKSSNNLQMKKLYFSDYSNSERVIKNPQIYVLTRTSLHTPSKYIFPSIQHRLKINKKMDLNELVPDFNEYNQNIKQKDYYEYFTKFKKNKKQKFIV